MVRNERRTRAEAVVLRVGAEILYKDDTPDCGGWAGKDDATKIVGSSALGGAHAMGQLPWAVAKVLSHPAELGLRQAGRDAPRERAVGR